MAMNRQCGLHYRVRTWWGGVKRYVGPLGKKRKKKKWRVQVHIFARCSVFFLISQKGRYVEKKTRSQLKIDGKMLFILWFLRTGSVTGWIMTVNGWCLITTWTVSRKKKKNCEWSAANGHKTSSFNTQKYACSPSETTSQTIMRTLRPVLGKCGHDSLNWTGRSRVKHIEIAENTPLLSWYLFKKKQFPEWEDGDFHSGLIWFLNVTFSFHSMWLKCSRSYCTYQFINKMQKKENKQQMNVNDKSHCSNISVCFARMFVTRQFSF